jgi:PadR family transcriptional regulator, regulatory protein PadR
MRPAETMCLSVRRPIRSAPSGPDPSVALDADDECTDSTQSLYSYSVDTGELAVADSLPLVKGTLDILVLKALSWAPMHGFEITEWLEQRSGGALGVQDSALYQALHRLEERGLTAAEWGVTENNQRARYYKLTRAGRAHLAAETEQWVRYADTVTGILTTT